MNLEHCTPSDIPHEISQYDGDVAQHIIHDVLFDEPPKNMITQVNS